MIDTHLNNNIGVIVAFGSQEKQILIEPVFAQVIQERIFNIGFQFQGIGILQMPLGPGDLLVHHAIALGLHVTMLILLKEALDARGSKLTPVLGLSLAVQALLLFMA